jgi:hypothetical protein
MKKILITFILFLNITNYGFSKILDLGSATLDVPNKYYLLNWSNSSMNGQLNLCTTEFDNCFGIIDKKLLEIVNRLDNGESFQDIKILNNLMKILSKQTQNCIEMDNGLCQSSMKRFWSKLKSTLKNNNSGTIFNYMEVKDSENYLNNLDLAVSVDEIREMTNSELKILTKEAKDQFTFGNKNYLMVNDDLGIKIKKFLISKNSKGSVFATLQGDASYVSSGMQFNAKLAFYISEKNNKLFTLDGMCIVNCSNFFNTFNQIVNKSFNTSSSLNITSSSNSDDFINQLNKLNDLYKSGVLTKEEFEKAKKKILN